MAFNLATDTGRAYSLAHRASAQYEGWEFWLLKPRILAKRIAAESGQIVSD